MFVLIVKRRSGAQAFLHVFLPRQLSRAAWSSTIDSRSHVSSSRRSPDGGGPQAGFVRAAR